MDIDEILPFSGTESIYEHWVLRKFQGISYLEMLERVSRKIQIKQNGEKEKSI